MTKVFGKLLSLKEISKMLCAGYKFEPYELYVNPEPERVKRKYVIYRGFLKFYILAFYLEKEAIIMHHIGPPTNDEISRFKEEKKKLKFKVFSFQI